MRPLLSTFIAGAVLTTAHLAPAQKIQNYGSGGFGLASTYAKLYDPTTTVSFAGRITGITVASPMNGAGNSVRVVVKAKNGGSSLVELGPEWYVNNQRVKLHLKDKVVVHGSKVMLDGRGSIMASRVSKGKQSLVLRDTSGRPFWNATAFAVRPRFRKRLVAYFMDREQWRSNRSKSSADSIGGAHRIAEGATHALQLQ